MNSLRFVLMKGKRMENKEQTLVFGRHATMESLKQGHGNKLFVQEDLKGEKIDRFLKEAKKQKVAVVRAPKHKLDQMTEKKNHQGLVLMVAPYAYTPFDGLIQTAKAQKDDPVFLVLDSIQDPHNLGSMMRTADATGVDGIIIPKHRATGVTPVVAKTSTGAVEHVPVARVTNLVQAVKQLKEEGFWIFGTDMKGTDYRKWNSKGAVALVIGNEGDGISPLLKKEVDEMVTIPMIGHVQSLNASVAASLMMYEVFRGRY